MAAYQLNERGIDMNYRHFEAAGMDVSLLGFGAMRLPVLNGDATRINEPEAIRLMRHAIDCGVNYIDTAYVYHGKNSEIAVGKALADGYREKVLLATKLPQFLIKGPEEIGAVLDEQLEKLATDHIDMYLVHDIRGSNWSRIKDWKIWDGLVKQREAGKIRFIGFSFHGESPAELKEVLDEYPWDFCQLQVNYMDHDLQGGIEGYNYAVSKGVPIVVMEPLKGGKLTDIMPPKIQKYWDSLGSDRTPAEWALRWVANLPGVLTILSGMSEMKHVEENLRVLSDADEGMLTDAEQSVISKVAEEYRRLIAYPCTDCKYCMPCAEGIDIPMIMDYRNYYDLYGKTRKMQGEFDFFVKVKPSACIACGKCMPECPQHLDIVSAMRETKDLFEK